MSDTRRVTEQDRHHYHTRHCNRRSESRCKLPYQLPCQCRPASTGNSNSLARLPSTDIRSEFPIIWLLFCHSGSRPARPPVFTWRLLELLLVSVRHNTLRGRVQSCYRIQDTLPLRICPSGDADSTNIALHHLRIRHNQYLEVIASSSPTICLSAPYQHNIAKSLFIEAFHGVCEDLLS